MMEDNREELEIDLGTLIWNFFRYLLKAWWLIPILALLAGAAGYVRSTQFYTPMYRSQATFTVMTGSTEDAGSIYNFYYDTTTAGQLARTFPYILSSDLLTEAICQELGTESVNGSISAQAISDSNMITMSVTSRDPEAARTILEAAIKVYPDVARFVLGQIRFNMIEVPTTPTEPYNRPNYSRTVRLWAIAGAVGGVLIIGLLALLRKTVQKPDELKTLTSLPCLGNLPQVRFKARGKENRQKLSVYNQRLPQSYKESIASLLVKVERELEARGGKVLLVTSTVSEEGKSSVAANLAYTAAAHGKKVLFVDGDLRKQTDGSLLGLPEGYGLEELLLQGEHQKETIRREEESGVWAICGSKPAKKIPSLLNHPRMKEIFENCSKHMDLIIVDAPPCELFEDAGILAEHADGILYVIRHDAVQRRRIMEGISDLEESSAYLLGYVFNGVPVHHRGYGYYGYGRYGYGYYGYGKYGRYGYGDSESAAEEGNETS